MATIVFDCRFASMATGIGTYIRGVVPLLLPMLEDDECVLLVHSKEEAWIPSGVRTEEISAKHYSVAEQFEVPKRLRSLRADLLFCPHFNVPYFCPVPFVATIHDLILHRYPNNVSCLKRFVYRMLMKRTISNARELIAVSAFTKNELLSVYGDDLAIRTTVTPEGFDSIFRKMDTQEYQPVLRNYGLKPGYLLYVGNAKQHKNVQMLLDAHASLEDLPPLVLVCGGAEAKALTLRPNVVRLDSLPHAELPALYNGAQCFVTPSLYEGFCLPILEAQACGCPVLASNCTAIPEVAGSHAVLFDPTPQGIQSALRNMPTNVDSPNSIYTWESAAKETCAILLRALHG